MSLRGFLGRFGRHELDDAEAFRAFVIGVLRERFAGLRVERDDEPLRIRLDANEFGLQNLHAVQQRDHPSREQIREIVVSHFERMFAEMDRTASPAPMYWTDVEPRLRPQIMPAEYAGQAPAPLAFVPLNEDVSIALVVDLENTYSYVRAEDLSLWGVSWDDAYA
ncbi:MAG TPA: hypothetical protein VHK90_12790, partial [Thermoanaerobaculia bacterium]|nr:hypothetical protein [Thermoanaerobaculia bacterium]